MIDVELLICDTWDDFDTAIALQTPVVMERLQHSCPEQHPFQQRLLGIAIRLQQRVGQTVIQNPRSKWSRADYQLDSGHS